VKTRKKPTHIGLGGSFQGVVAGLDLNLNLMTLRDRWNSITGVVVFSSPKAILSLRARVGDISFVSKEDMMANRTYP